MAKKKTPVKSGELDGKEFFAAIEEIEKERNIPQSYMLEKITQALIAAYKRNHEGLAFVAMNPFALLPDYGPVLQSHELEELAVRDSTELAFYVLCVVKNPVADSTVNLKCPVAINPDTRAARQVILETDLYEMRHPLAEFGKKEAAPC